MGKYDWLVIINLIAWGYLFLLFIDVCRSSIICAKRNKWSIKFIFKEIIASFRSTFGIGSISFILLSLGFVWLSKCDEILEILNVPSWSNGNTGNHIGSYYVLIFFIPAYIVSYKFNKDFGAKLLMKLSGVLSFVYAASATALTFCR